MRICYLGNASSSHIERWVRFFVEDGHDVHIISFEAPRRKMDGVTVHHVPTRKKLIIPFTFHHKVRQFRRIIRRIRPDIVHAHYITKYGIMAPYMGFNPYVLSAWGSDVLLDLKGPFVGRVKKLLALKAIRNAEWFHTDGIKTKQGLIQLGANEERILLSFFGIESDRFVAEKRSEELRSKLELEGTIAIISLRTMEPIYDVETLVRAIPLVISNSPDARFLILGGGRLRQSLEALCAKLGVSEYVNFIGRIPLTDMPAYLASADIYVSTSLSDAGLAASTGEVMACETPVIITEDPDNRLWVEHGVNGFIIPTSNPQALADKINLLVANEELRKTIGARGRTIIIEKNNYEIEMRKILDMYELVISKS